MTWLAKIKAVRNKNRRLASDIAQGRPFATLQFERACALLAKLFPDSPAEQVAEYLRPSFSEMHMLDEIERAANRIAQQQTLIADLTDVGKCLTI